MHTSIQRPPSRKAGIHAFTLVEIMIVVAIIALLAAIAVPGFLRARERAQATNILNEARLISSAVAQYAIEQHQPGSATVIWDDVKVYLKTSGNLVSRNGNDPFGRAYLLTDVVSGTQIDAATKNAFDSAVVPSTFWDGY